LAYPVWDPEARRPLPLLFTLDEFRREFPGESAWVEFKEGVSTTRVQEAVVAFSNSDGGVLLLGVRDDAAPLGRELTGETQADIHRAIGQVTNPGRFEIAQLHVVDVPLIVVAVARRREGVAQMPNGAVLVRRGASSVPLLGEGLVRLMAQRTLTRFETTSVDATLAQASDALVERLAEVWGWTSDGVEDRLIEAGLALGEDGVLRLTVAGALYLLDDPHEVLGKAYIELFRYPAGEADYDRRVQITGPLDAQVEQAAQALRDELGTQLVVLGARRHELERLPTSVIREAIANAVAHRSYQATGSSVRIEVRPEAVRVISPGPLPEPVTVTNIRQQNAARNRRVITHLRRLGLAEDAGRGVDHMQDSMQANLLEPPTFEDDGSQVTVILPTRSSVAPEERAWVLELESRGDLEPSDRILLIQAARHGAVTNSDARDLLGVDSVHARAALQRLRDAGLLVQYGRRGGTQYVLAGDLSPPSGLRLAPDELDDVVLDLAGQQPLTNTLVRERTGLDRAQALALLQRLVTAGRLVQVGQRRGTKYLLPDPPD